MRKRGGRKRACVRLVVEDDPPPAWPRSRSGAHELLMAVALHVAADDGPVEDVELSTGRGRRL